MLFTNIFSFLHNVLYLITAEICEMDHTLPVPYDKILDQTKLRAFANNISNAKKMIISVFDRVENIVVKIPSKGVIVWEWIKL